MNWPHVHQSLLGISVKEIHPILTATLEILFGKFQISELHSNLFKAYYLSQTNQFTIVQVQLAQSLLTQYISQQPPNALYDILESIVTLTKQQLLKDRDTPQLQEHVYEQLLKSGISSQRSKSATPKQNIKIDYSQLKLTKHKRQKTAFMELSSSVQIQDANAKADNYKLNKSTYTTEVPLRQMPKSKLHNYYVKVILRNVDNSHK